MLVVGYIVDLPTDPNGKGPLAPVAALDDGHLAPKEAPGPVEDLVRVAVLGDGEAVVSMVRHAPIVGVQVRGSHCGVTMSKIRKRFELYKRASDGRLSFVLPTITAKF